MKRNTKHFLLSTKMKKKLVEIVGDDRREYQYYKHIDMWNEQRVSVFNQMPANAQNNNQ